MKHDPSLPYIAPSPGFVNWNRRVHLPDFRGVEPMRKGEERFWRRELRRDLRRTKLRPDDALSHAMLALSRRRLMRLTTALRDLDRAISLEPAWASLYFDRGNTLFDLHRYEEAIRDYDQAVDRGYGMDHGERWRDRGRAVVFFNRALSLDELRRPEEAVLDYGRALELHPDHTDALNNRGNILNELGRYEEALMDFDRGVAVAPDDALMHANRANSLIRLGRLDDGLAACERALSINGRQPFALYNKACALALQGDSNEAVRWLERAIQRDPQSREDAREDPDFADVRDRPEFISLLS